MHVINNSECRVTYRVGKWFSACNQYMDAFHVKLMKEFVHNVDEEEDVSSEYEELEKDYEEEEENKQE